MQTIDFQDTTTRTEIVNIYDDPRNPGRLTEEYTAPAGTPIRDLEHSESGREPWTFSLQIGEDGSWYRVRSWRKPATMGARIRALVEDLAWFPDVRAAVRAGLSIDAIAGACRQEAPEAWREKLTPEAWCEVARRLQAKVKGE